MVSNRKRRDRRVPLTAQLSPGDDDDLIEWLGSIKSGNRAGAIKAAVRAGLGFPQHGRAEIDTSDLVTQDEIDQLKKHLDDWAGSLTDHLRAEMIRMVSDLAAGQGIVMTPTATDTGTIDNQRKTKRDKRIKSAKW